MKTYIPVSITFLLISISLLYFVLIQDDTFLAGSMATSTPTVTQAVNITTPRMSPVVTPSVTPTPTPSPNEEVYYPMTRYEERMTNRWYGKRIVESDSEPLPCGDPFSGFHTGDDLEAFENELDIDIPVYAIADGTVRVVGAVAGYGGLIILEHSLEGRVITGYYGHIDISDAFVKMGDEIQAGEQIAVLGDDCSPQTSGERKHLHFSILDGREIDVRGYVNNESELTNWLNPANILKRLNAQSP